MPEKILTLHPGGKNGVNIDLDKYNIVKAAVMKVIHENQVVSFTQLQEETAKELEAKKFIGSTGWYTVSIKLDLEARGVILHNRKTRMITFAKINDVK